MGRLRHLSDLLLAKGRAVLAAQGGVAAVEFALLAPVLLLVYFGSVDLSQGIEADRKLAYVTNTLGDLTAQTTGEVSYSDIEGLMGIADTVLRPFDASRVSLRITVADVASDGSYSLHEPPVTRGGTASACSGTVTIPDSMRDLARGHSVIITEGCYAYKPVVGYVLDTDVPLYKRNFHLPRAENFAYAGGSSGSGGGGSGTGGGSGGEGTGEGSPGGNTGGGNNGDGNTGGGNNNNDDDDDGGDDDDDRRGGGGRPGGGWCWWWWGCR